MERYQAIYGLGVAYFARDGNPRCGPAPWRLWSPLGRVCTWCGEPLKGRQQRWCCNECAAEAMDSKAGFRESMLSRNPSTRMGPYCEICGVDWGGIERWWHDLMGTDRATSLDLPRNLWRQIPRAWGMDPETSFLEVDHIVPIVEGGVTVPWNLRAICQVCHKQETAKLAARRAQSRKAETQLRLLDEAS